jgi:sarcosine oxidase gamma subunit
VSRVGLDFLSPDLATPDVAATRGAWRSPLERALRDSPAEIADISLTGKLEIRGDLTTFTAKGFELVSITPTRGLVLCDFTKTAKIRERLEESFLVIDVSAGLAGLQVRGETLMRRLTDLDLETLPAVGSLAHVQVYVLRGDGDEFRIFFPQEYGHYLAEVVIDAAEGLAQ